MPVTSISARAAVWRIAEVEALLDPSGAVFFPAFDALVVADMHFEKGSAYARYGIMLPPFDTRATLATLECVLSHYRPASVFSLGDAFHDGAAELRISDVDAARLTSLVASTQWHWVLGNHDPVGPQRFSGRVSEQAMLGPLLLAHEPGEAPAWNLAGHLHPCAAVVRNGARVRRRCFIDDGMRMILPAFGAYTGGLNVLDPAYLSVFGGPEAVHVAGDQKTYRVPLTALRPDDAATQRRRIRQ